MLEHRQGGTLQLMSSATRCYANPDVRSKVLTMKRRRRRASDICDANCLQKTTTSLTLDHATLSLVLPSHAQRILAEGAVALSVTLGGGALSACCIFSILKRFIANEILSCVALRAWSEFIPQTVLALRGSYLGSS